MNHELTITNHHNYLRHGLTIHQHRLEAAQAQHRGTGGTWRRQVQHDLGEGHDPKIQLSMVSHDLMIDYQLLM